MKIIIHKFKRLVNLTIEIPADISGGNGTGKTTILEAISFCLTGKDQGGNEFKTLYDNRVDLHQALADVSYFDDYGNEYRRIVRPVFQINRKGVEEIKILRSTTCQKNKLDVNDYSGEFTDFYRFGTDYFFRQKEAEQRGIFIDLMKSKLPNYDVVTAQTQLKTLKSTQKNTMSEIKTIQLMVQEIIDVEVPEIGEELKSQEAEYQNVLRSMSSNSALVADINRRNNWKAEEYWRALRELISNLDKERRSIPQFEADIKRLKSELEQVTNVSFAGYEMTDTTELEAEITNLKEKLAGLTYWSDLKDYARKHGATNPVVAENMRQIKLLETSTPGNLPEGYELTDICPTCGVKSQEALNLGVGALVTELKNENRSALQREMSRVNSDYTLVADELERKENQLNRIQRENKGREEKNATDLRAFQLRKTNEAARLQKEIKAREEAIKAGEAEVKRLEGLLQNLKEPTPEKLPTEITIDEGLKEAHAEYKAMMERVVGAVAINNNNAETRQKNELNIQKKREALMEVDETIARLQAEISDYFSNLKGVVEREFTGEIKIGVELLEYVLTRDEYRDVFRITANDKVFPFECNGAMINNTKLQVLATLQRLQGYSGITIFDNAEANTTEPLNYCGLNLVVTRATMEKSLTFK